MGTATTVTESTTQCNEDTAAPVAPVKYFIKSLKVDKLATQPYLAQKEARQLHN